MDNADSFAAMAEFSGLMGSGGGAALQATVEVAARVLLAFALAMFGGLISSMIAISHARLCRLISSAAGMLMGVTIFSIIPETYSTMPPGRFAAALVSGYLVFLLISRYVFHVCPACAASHFDEAATHRFGEIAAALIVALGLHSTMDGMALALGKDADMAGALSATLLLAVCVHKVPEGLALCALLLAAGFRRPAALGLVAAVESTTLVGGAIGLWAAPKLTLVWLDTLLAHVGGGFIFLAVHAVFGELIKHSRASVLVSFGAGVVVIGALRLILQAL